MRRRWQLAGVSGTLLLLVTAVVWTSISESAVDNERIAKWRGQRSGVVVRISERSAVYSHENALSVRQWLLMAGHNNLSAISNGTLDKNLFGGESVFVDFEGDNIPRSVHVGRMNFAEMLALGLCLDINRARWEDLKMVRGIGEKTAKAIVKHRCSRGRYKSVDDLLALRGIGEKRLQTFRDQLCVR